MDYIGKIIRPPNEAESILLQVTTGCTHNKCTFCGVYKEKAFGLKPMETILKDIRYAAAHYRDVKRLFLCDGDALSVETETLLFLIDEIKTHLPWIRQIGCYGNAGGIMKKSPRELARLKAHGLKIVYLGLESGDDHTLKKIKKGVTAAQQIREGQKIKEAGLKLSVTVLTGIADPGKALIHAQKTGEALTAIGPDYIGALMVMVIPGTALEKEIKSGESRLPTPQGHLAELKTMLEYTTLKRGIFSANHASNYLPLQLMLPRDKEKGLMLLKEALENEGLLKPEWLRGL